MLPGNKSSKNRDKITRKGKKDEEREDVQIYVISCAHIEDNAGYSKDPDQARVTLRSLDLPPAIKFHISSNIPS